MLKYILTALFSIIGTFTTAMSTLVVVHKWRSGAVPQNLTVEEIQKRNLDTEIQIQYLKTLVYSSRPPTIPSQDMLGALYSTQEKFNNSLVNIIGWVKNHLPASEGVPHDVEAAVEQLSSHKDEINTTTI
jgi:hypothetical protein